MPMIAREPKLWFCLKLARSSCHTGFFDALDSAIGGAGRPVVIRSAQKHCRFDIAEKPCSSLDPIF